ncbi:hypothetical protein PR202_gn00666 [Eleusine coracana subsp. coracana]|uniref:Uncharacterized protein n=1 Tax=Eleusine coracana subsp. coracana TaxID=191504 RepID=A0AAV5G2N9_ELECO|nr:hypothetical protein PR202_gn00666 [Eleusine coracana subsp. coracana]
MSWIYLRHHNKRLQVNVLWKKIALRKYETSVLNNLPEIHKLELVPKGTEDSVALPGCLEAFLKEEPLGPEDMWVLPLLQNASTSDEEIRSLEAA